MSKKNVMQFRTANDGLNDEVSLATGLDFSEDIPENRSRTDQSQKDDADINVIVKRFGLTGEMPAAKTLPQYGDFTGVDDYQTALNQILLVDDAFAELPADVRFKFENDPGRLWNFLHDPKNEAEARELGLLKPLPAPVEPQLVRVVPDPTPAPVVSPGGN